MSLDDLVRSQSRILGTVASVVNHSYFLDVYSFLRRKITESQVAILAYHRVCPKRDNWSLQPISPADFEKQVRYLCQTHELLSLDKLTGHIQNGKPLPKKAAVLTLDDGYKDNYTYAYPILKKYNAPATIFLTSGYIDTGKLFPWDEISYAVHHTVLRKLEIKELGEYPLHSQTDRVYAASTIWKRLLPLSEDIRETLIKRLIKTTNVDIHVSAGRNFVLSWDEVREMKRGGITFGAHSVTHPNLTKLPLEQARKEIFQSKETIERELRCSVNSFSYPNGNFNSQLVSLVKESGIACAVTTITKTITAKTNLHTLGRISPGWISTHLKCPLPDCIQI